MTPVQDAAASRLRWMVLVTVIVGTFLGRLDQTIVNLALPKIIGDFGITVNSAAWIATAYILANAVFVPIWGKLGDTIGRKKVYIIGFSVFILGSVLAGLAWNLGSMIVFRIIQAVAGSADYPTAMAIIAVTFPGERDRAQALGIWSSSFAAAAVFGPLLGGPLIDAFGWRSVFLINLPVGILGLVMAQKYITESVSGRTMLKFDWWGAITLGGALTSLVLVLDKGLDWGWLSMNAFVAYAAIITCTAAFFAIERRHPDPIVDMKFFRIPTFTNALLNNFVVFMGMMGSMFLIPLFVTTFLGYDATQTGLVFMPMAAGMMLAAPIGGRLTGKVSPRWVIGASTAVAAFGIWMFSFLDPRSSLFDVCWPLFIMAFGLGFGMSQRTAVVASSVPQSEIGVASSILALGRNIAGAFGIAVFGTILSETTKRNVLQIGAASVVNATDAASRATAMGLVILKSEVEAYSTVFTVAATVVAAGAVAVLLMRDVKIRKGEEIMIE